MNLKSCPFCGSKDIRNDESIPVGSVIMHYVYWCGNCGALGPKHLSFASAMKMWNLRRPTSSLLAALKWAALAASKDPNRRVLRHLNVKNGRTVACDGYRIHEIATPPGLKEPARGPCTRAWRQQNENNYYQSRCQR